MVQPLFSVSFLRPGEGGRFRRAAPTSPPARRGRGSPVPTSRCCSTTRAAGTDAVRRRAGTSAWSTAPRCQRRAPLPGREPADLQGATPTVTSARCWQPLRPESGRCSDVAPGADPGSKCPFRGPDAVREMATRLGASASARSTFSAERLINPVLPCTKGRDRTSRWPRSPAGPTSPRPPSSRRPDGPGPPTTGCRIFTPGDELPFVVVTRFLGSAHAWPEAGGGGLASDVVQEAALAGAGSVAPSAFAFAAPPPWSAPAPGSTRTPEVIRPALWILRSTWPTRVGRQRSGWVGVLLADAEAVLAPQPDWAASGWTSASWVPHPPAAPQTWRRAFCPASHH